MTRQKLVIVGHGMVAQRLLEHLCDRTTTLPYNDIVVLSGEPVSAYNRILLSSWLAGDAEPESLTLKPDEWFTERGITLRQGDPVSRIDRARKQVHTGQGHIESYDRLVLATGSRSATLGLTGEDLDDVVGFRDLRDTRKLIEISQRHRRAVVIGGGFLGLEAAEGLRQRGMSVTLLHRGSHLLNRQLDEVGGALLERSLTDRGLSVQTRTSPVALLGNRQVRAVQLDNDTLISTDLVVIAAGITPNAELGKEAGLACERAILVNERLQTSDPAIFALGECCQFDDLTFGLVDPGYQQAQVLAEVICGSKGASESDAVYTPDIIPTRLKISGIPIFSCGQTRPDHNTESLVWQDHSNNRYCRLLIRDRTLAGVVLFGETRDGPWYTEQIQQGTDISDFRSNLVFGPAFCEAAA